MIIFRREGCILIFTRMNQNANSYGFYKVYTNHPQRSGFAYEPWHWSYAPLSIPMLQQYLTMNWKQHIVSPDLTGADALTSDFLERYRKEWILGINPDLLPKP